MAEFRFDRAPGDGGNLAHAFEGPPIHARGVVGDRVNEAIAWCLDENRPGLFCQQSIGPMGSLFYFTDPNVAFEFRMTWG